MCLCWQSTPWNVPHLSAWYGSDLHKYVSNTLEDRRTVRIDEGGEKACHAIWDRTCSMRWDNNGKEETKSNIEYGNSVIQILDSKTCRLKLNLSIRKGISTWSLIHLFLVMDYACSLRVHANAIASDLCVYWGKLISQSEPAAKWTLRSGKVRPIHGPNSIRQLVRK